MNNSQTYLNILSTLRQRQRHFLEQALYHERAYHNIVKRHLRQNHHKASSNSYAADLANSLMYDADVINRRERRYFKDPVPPIADFQLQLLAVQGGPTQIKVGWVSSFSHDISQGLGKQPKEYQQLLYSAAWQEFTEYVGDVLFGVGRYKGTSLHTAVEQALSSAILNQKEYNKGLLQNNMSQATATLLLSNINNDMTQVTTLLGANMLEGWGSEMEGLLNNSAALHPNMSNRIKETYGNLFNVKDKYYDYLYLDHIPLDHKASIQKGYHYISSDNTFMRADGGFTSFHKKDLDQLYYDGYLNTDEGVQLLRQLLTEAYGVSLLEYKGKMSKYATLVSHSLESKNVSWDTIAVSEMIPHYKTTDTFGIYTNMPQQDYSDIMYNIIKGKYHISMDIWN